MLGEPTNDLDTDMLAAIEDLLDSFAGTLLVVSHDRYLLERVTDQQYAILGGRMRHLPGGVDEYLTLRDAEVKAPASSTPSTVSATPASRLTGAEEHAARKEIGATERKLERLSDRIARIHERMASHDQGDYEGLARLSEELREAESETEALEERWLELSELTG